ncbi:MAG: selenocysteine lyase [Bacteroidetes bacterium GWF2_38_335]|nr:MAG: selenocysteine lyase [Bacteroidetes bacterium GWF2_38_335]OFY80228.1 MAG: selenocysteine lyase [Bacteroidetes bacterium RIFOXYA12_FULL_38_20]HBS88745.1 selenocysteine lyase [Bacteroidales bacterium]
MDHLERYFNKFRSNIIGNDAVYKSPYGDKKIIYADWIASGRLYKTIADKLTNDIGPFVANTHTETSETGKRMTQAYHHAHELIKKHVNASTEDVILTTGFGMTGAVNKFQRILRLKSCSECPTKQTCEKIKNNRPVVFVTHMEHHSNHTSWYGTNAEVVVIDPDENMLFSEKNLEIKLQEYKDWPMKIGAFTACSNVTGIITPYYKMAKIMHKHGGLCFIDFAASAPYVDINMHPEDPEESLDAIYFSPHKFLGGPGSSGTLIFNKKLYNRDIPDCPGGGTVDWTNPWGDYKFIDDIELREDGGTPGFLQAIQTALCIQLKNEMGTEMIRARETELVELAFREFNKIKELVILADNIKDRIGCISFYIPGIHYNLMVKLLSDRFGVQVRGGCACAGTYGHFLLNVTPEQSKAITDKINTGDLSEKPGWVRLSIHPTMTTNELIYIIGSIKEINENIEDWKKDYYYDSKTNEFYHNSFIRKNGFIHKWFSLNQ